MNLSVIIRRNPAAAFIILTLLLSLAATLAPVGDQDRFMLLAALLVPIPTIVALALSAVTGGIRPFLRAALRLNLDVRWALIALGIALAARLSVGVLALLTGASPALQVSAAGAGLVVVIFLFALLEEIGWRGFALRRLVERRSPLVALLITGIPWSAIHIFFYLAQDETPLTMALVFVLNFALTVMVTWAYLRAGQNVWVAAILHGGQTLFAILNANIAPELVNPYSAAVYSLIALVIIAADWDMWVARPEEAKSAAVMPTAA